MGFAFFGAGSSSEKDSQAASSRVTVASQHVVRTYVVEGFPSTYQDTLRRL